MPTGPCSFFCLCTLGLKQGVRWCPTRSLCVTCARCFTPPLVEGAFPPAAQWGPVPIHSPAPASKLLAAAALGRLFSLAPGAQCWPPGASAARHPCRRVPCRWPRRCRGVPAHVRARAAWPAPLGVPASVVGPAGPRDRLPGAGTWQGLLSSLCPQVAEAPAPAASVVGWGGWACGARRGGGGWAGGGYRDMFGLTGGKRSAGPGQNAQHAGAARSQKKLRGGCASQCGVGRVLRLYCCSGGSLRFFFQSGG